MGQAARLVSGVTQLDHFLHSAAMKVTCWLAKVQLCVLKRDSGRIHRRFVSKNYSKLRRQIVPIELLFFNISTCFKSHFNFVDF